MEYRGVFFDYPTKRRPMIRVRTTRSRSAPGALRVETSMARVLSPDDRNLARATPEAASLALEYVERNLRDVGGLRLDLGSAEIQRLDVARDEPIDGPFLTLLDLFDAASDGRSRSSRFYPDGAVLGTKKTPVAFYDKGEHLKAKRLEVGDLPANLVRAEARAHGAEAVYDVFGISEVGEIPTSLYQLDWHRSRRVHEVLDYPDRYESRPAKLAGLVARFGHYLDVVPRPFDTLIKGIGARGFVEEAGDLPRAEAVFRASGAAPGATRRYVKQLVSMLSRSFGWYGHQALADQAHGVASLFGPVQPRSGRRR